jgi:hypothetical protein
VGVQVRESSQRRPPPIHLLFGEDREGGLGEVKGCGVTEGKCPTDVEMASVLFENPGIFFYYRDHPVVRSAACVCGACC